jgi:2-dehydro-3-deoxyphosphogluconate aldolase / (4S)-4-hydroxy-2-oxoglutarate aldolase
MDTLNDNSLNIREKAVYWVKKTGVLPAMKLKHEEESILPYVQAMLDAGVGVVEVTMTTPGVLRHFEAMRKEFGDRVLPAAGTTLDAAAARDAIMAGAKVIVSPATIPAVIETAHRYGAACFIGAFTATEVLGAMLAGAEMVKIFPATLGGPKYMTNLKMVYPEVNLIPSGGISLENAGEFIKCGACAISGARNFFDYEKVSQHGPGWITEQCKKYIQIVAEARKAAPPLP